MPKTIKPTYGALQAEVNRLRTLLREIVRVSKCNYTRAGLRCVNYAGHLAMEGLKSDWNQEEELNKLQAAYGRGRRYSEVEALETLSKVYQNEVKP